MKYFLDTNIIIYALKNTFPLIKTHFYEVPSQSIEIPAIVMAEIEYGARKSNNYDETIKKYLEFTSVFEKTSFSNMATQYYGKIRTDLEKRGEVIGANDLMIAATVLAEDGILITHNIKEFKRINGLRLEDWAET